VWDFSQAPNHTVLVVALVLADHADHHGEVHMTLPAVAEQARVARSTVWDAIRALKRLGELETQHQGGDGPKDANRYRITLVDNLALSAREPDPSKVPKRSRKGPGLSGAKPNSLDTNYAAPVVPLPPPVDKAVLQTKMAELRAQLPKGRRR
jgi:hypothetical protein